MTGKRSCDECRYSGTPGVHYVDPAEGRDDFTAEQLAKLEPYPVPCPAVLVDDERQRVEQIVADQHTSAFKAAKEIVADAAARYPQFSANEIRRELDAAQIPGPIVGAAFSWASREGLIEASGRMVPSTDPGTNGHRLFLWTSLRWRQGRSA